MDHIWINILLFVVITWLMLVISEFIMIVDSKFIVNFKIVTHKL